MPPIASTVMPFHSAVATTSIRLPAPSPPTICAPSNRPVRRSATILMRIRCAPE